MQKVNEREVQLRKTITALTGFSIVAALHMLWYYRFGRPMALGADPWAAGPISWWALYLDAGGPWLAYAYGLTGAFTLTMFSNFLASRRAKEDAALEGQMAVGGLTLSGALAAGLCFFMGCCGSPLLAVWLSVFGASFLPYEKPLIAVITTLMLGTALFWMKRRKKCSCNSPSTC